MLGIEKIIKMSLARVKVMHNLPGRLRLKIPYLSNVPVEGRKYDELIIRAIKILKGIETININYTLGTVLITYDINKLYEKKILSWINKVTNVFVNNIDLFKAYGNTNLDYVVNTVEHQLKDAVKEYS